MAVSDAAGAATSYQRTGPATTVTGPTGVERILQANGLSELAAVCEVTNLAGGGSCGLDATGTGYLTTYSYGLLGNITGVGEAGQKRTFVRDAFGRLNSETTPESSTTSFAYGSAPACGSGSYPGSLAGKQDNMGNVTCLAYDLLGRVTGISYPSGPYASATPVKTFIYDSASVDGTAMANAIGRLAEAYTGASGAKITDQALGTIPWAAQRSFSSPRLTPAVFSKLK